MGKIQHLEFPIKILIFHLILLLFIIQIFILEPIGIINYYNRITFGHYTAYCLNGGKWFEYNDDSVTYIKEDNVVSSQAYVLFYKRKNN